MQGILFKEDSDYLFELSKTMRITDIAKYYSVSSDTIIKQIKINRPEFIAKRNYYDVNENYFEKIDTEDKAYWLGFLYADGCIFKNHNSFALSFSLNTKDYDHLKNFQKHISSNHLISTFKTMSTLRIQSSKFCTDLIKLGCVPRKSLILEFPNENQVPKHLLRHFIRGYFDGDGCIFFNKKHRSVSFIGTFSFLTGLLDKLCLLSNLPKQKLNKVKNCYTLFYNSKIDTIIFFNFIYQKSTIYLNRKYEKFLALLQTYGDLNSIKRKIYDRKCSVNGCNRRHASHGYCQTHLRYYKLGGIEMINNHIYINKLKQSCSIFNCHNKYCAKGYCRKHYMKMYNKKSV